MDGTPPKRTPRANKSETFDCLKFTLEGAGYDPMVMPERLPLTCGQPIRVEAHGAPDDSIALRVRRDGGPVTMSGMAFA